MGIEVIASIPLSELEAKTLATAFVLQKPVPLKLFRKDSADKLAHAEQQLRVLPYSWAKEICIQVLMEGKHAD